MPPDQRPAAFLYDENHWRGQWFKRALAVREKSSLCYNGSAVCQLHKQKA
jgi:hypothetical protein